MANLHDTRAPEPLIDAIPAIRQCCRRPRKRPAKLHADKGYDFSHCRRALSKRNIEHPIARRGIESSERLGRYRWVVERTLPWFSQFRRLTIRCKRRADIHKALLTLAAAIICFRFCFCFVQNAFCLGF